MKMELTKSFWHMAPLAIALILKLQKFLFFMIATVKSHNQVIRLAELCLDKDADKANISYDQWANSLRGMPDLLFEISSVALNLT